MFECSTIVTNDFRDRIKSEPICGSEKAITHWKGLCDVSIPDDCAKAKHRHWSISVSSKSYVYVQTTFSIWILSFYGYMALNFYYSSHLIWKRWKWIWNYFSISSNARDIEDRIQNEWCCKTIRACTTLEHKSVWRNKLLFFLFPNASNYFSFQFQI